MRKKRHTVRLVSPISRLADRYIGRSCQCPRRAGSAKDQLLT